MSNKNHKFIALAFLSVQLFFSSTFALGQEAVKIGRSQLSLPDFSQWSISEVSLPGVVYSGDVSGTIPIQSKRMQYKSVDGLVKAVITTSMTKSAVNAQMSWDNTCLKIQANENIYLQDKGSAVRLDCLVVIKAQRLLSMSQRVDPKKQLFGEVVPHTLGGYYVQYSLGLSNGAQTTSFMLLADGLKGLQGDAITNPSKIPDPVVRWAIAFAKANSSALTSFSGDWALPQISFN
jgi:hypothetical protein